LTRHPQGNLFVVSGPSGVGKGTVIAKLLEKVKGIKKSVSATTRKPRQGERNGLDYFFKSQADFQKMIDQKELMEWAEYAGNLYGTPLKWVEDELKEGVDVILEIDIEGAKQIHNKYPQSILIFLSPPSLLVLEQRLKNRDTETAEKIAWRLNKAKEEITEKHIFQCEVVNDRVDEAVNNLEHIVYAERAKHSRSFSSS
jgi:guanylate kinase